MKNEDSNSKVVYVPRPRLCQVLEQATKRKLVCVIAGAGYGKTQAVRHYIERQKDAVVRWIQLTENDNSSSRYWEGLVHTVSLDNQELASKLRELGFPKSHSQFKQFVELTRNFEDHAAKIFFVFDDLHTIYDEEVLMFLERCFYMNHLNVYVIILTRYEPEINIVPLITKDAVSIITEKELCYTTQEIEALFAYYRMSFATDELKQLIEVTKCWALAINMFILILRRKRAPNHFKEALAAMKQNSFKLLEFEAWESLTESVQKKMVKLSLISNLSIDPLQEIFGDITFLQNASELATFIWFNSFTNDFKIHPLYLEFLQSKSHILSSQEIQETYQLAAKLCLKNGFYMDAIYYYAKINQYDLMIQTFFSYPLKLSRDASEYFLTVLQQLDTNNTSKKEQSFLFLKNYFTPLFLAGSGKYQLAETYTLKIIKEWKKINTPFATFLLYNSYSILAYIDTYLCTITHDYKSAEYLKKSVEYYKSSSIPPVEVASAFVNADLRSFACLVGEGASLSDFDAYMKEVKRVSKLIDQTHYKIYAGYEELVACEYAFFKNELELSRSYGYKAISKARQYHQYSIVAFAENYLLQIALHEGNTVLVKGILKQLRSHLSNPNFWNRQLDYDLYTGFFYTKTELLEKMPQWLILDELETKVEQHIFSRELIVTLSSYISSKKYHQALSVVCTPYPREAHERFLFGELRITLMTAVARIRTCDIKGAMRDFQKAYEASFEGLFELFFIELGKELHPLVEAAIKDEDVTIPTRWLRQIDRKASIYAKKSAMVATSLKSKRKDQHIAPLSNRESQVLVDLYHGLSREEIALNQHLSINTVKKILQSIYTKLDANNKVDAVRIAIEKGLVD